VADPLDLDAIEARAAAATPGPWTTSSEWSVRTGARDDELVACVQYKDHGRDAAFIAAARTDVPALVAECRALRAVADAARTLRERRREWHVAIQRADAADKRAMDADRQWDARQAALRAWEDAAQAEGAMRRAGDALDAALSALDGAGGDECTATGERSE
jgi:hypothetical protein